MGPSDELPGVLRRTSIPTSPHLGQIIDSLLHDLDLSGHFFPDLYDLAHVGAWELCNLHDLGPVSWVGSVLRTWYTDIRIQHNVS